jgi:alkyl sulfatase BDS1-like metallo-beta-lactamase superfamily hydrolase
MAGIHRTRPGAEDIAPAEEGPAVGIGEGLWMSKGVSNSYAIGTDDGRVVLNAGLPFEGRIRRRSFDDVCPGDTRSLVITQGHADHFAGYRGLVDEGTDILMQENWRLWKAEHELLPSYRVRNTSFAWSHMMEAMIAGLADLPEDEWEVTFPEPTVDFSDRLELDIGGRRIVLLSTPGGETTDALVVWVPDESTVFTGNLFGPLFGHVPNLVTIRGDRYREASLYVEAADLVLSLKPERLATGHFDPIEGRDLITEEVTNLRDSTQWVYDRVIEGMEAGTDVRTLMREIRVPEHFDVGEAYGRTAWNVRAIWETHAGWFHHETTTELFGVPASSVATDLLAAAGADALVAAARDRFDAGDLLEAIHLVEVVLAADPTVEPARAVGAEAHERLLEQSTNFWESAWLRRAAAELRGAQ